MYGYITCFRCGGEGLIYRYEGELGTRKNCPACYGRGSLTPNCFLCIKCKGKGQVYEYDDDLGQRYECPLCKNLGYTLERYLECQKCKGGGRIYPFQEEKLGVPKGCIPCNAIGYIKERDYYNINFNENNYNYYYNKPIDPRYAGNYTIQGATQGQYNPLENRNMVWQKIPEEDYSVGVNFIYGDDMQRQRSQTNYGPQPPISAGQNYNYNNNYNNDYNYGRPRSETLNQQGNPGMVNSSDIYHSQGMHNNSMTQQHPQAPGGYPQAAGGYPQAPGGYPQFNDDNTGYYNNNYNKGYY